MPYRLHLHPFSSYCQKVVTALDEMAVPFEPVLLETPESHARLRALWPLGKFPVLEDGARVVAEASVIVEHAQLGHGTDRPMIPRDPEAAIEVRMWDRFSDQYVMGPMQAIVADALRPADARDAFGVTRARAALDTTYAMLDARMAGREWLAGDFGLADCAAAPALLYADWMHPIPAALADLRAYRARLLARPSYARALDAARPYRHLFPPGAPDRD